METETRKGSTASMVMPPTPPESLGDAEHVKVDTTALSTIPLPPSHDTVTEVLDIDKKTPDNWLPRDPRLIRLTGVHPFNVEAPLSALFDEGFLTSPNLFYVRNHGAVPQVHDDQCLDWEFSVEGLVENPIKLKLRDLIDDFKNITCPVTLVCAGNRRREQNIVRKTKGFSWGAAGTSTALWTGVTMADVIRKAQPKRAAKYVHMLGADQLPKGVYETSIKMNWVMDPNRGIMLAHRMNGEALTPDHGKPLRVIIPGQIGGRSVKWLTKLVVSDSPSTSYYHERDNRVLPGMISPEQSDLEPKWWQDERYAIYDLSPNSAIAYPAHDEKIPLSGPAETYNVKGYAYSGGGRRITRAEISLDKGKSWRLANIDYPEDRYREAGEIELCGGTLDMAWRESSFCWCFWNLEIAITELADAKDIFVRTMDESMCIQPRDMYWSVLGMMNNPWFRIVLTKQDDQLLCTHPAPPFLTGGWMDAAKKKGMDVTNGYWGESPSGEVQETIQEEPAKELKMTDDNVSKIITIDDLRKHDGQDGRDSWFVLNGHVYDGTPFMNDHPGGATSIVAAAGLDSTDEFMAIHSETAKLMMPQYHIGVLNEEGKAALHGEDEATDSAPAERFLAPKSWKKAALHSKQIISADTRVFRFKLEHEEQILGLPTGQHLMMRFKDPKTQEVIIRSYTPTSAANHQGFLDILIKVYFEGPGKPGGKMSQAIDRLPIGETIDFKGPIGKFEYIGKGLCTVQGTEKRIKNFIMICGGSGITPIFQVYRAIMQDKEDETKCVVLDGNRLAEDILCKAELDVFHESNEHKSRLLYTLTKAPEAWEGLVGRIAAPLLEKEANPKDYDRSTTLILLCGPEALEKSAHKALLDLGWTDNEMLFF